MNLQNMAPNAKRSLMISAIFVVVAVGVYLGAVEPAISKREETGRRLSELRFQHDSMQRNLAGADRLKTRMNDLREKLAPYHEAMLTPLLESLAMRTKSTLDPIAFGAGLADTEYTELSAIALPVPKRLPYQLHARQPIMISAHGSYQSAISFLLQVEKKFPLVSLEAIEITAQNDPNTQRIVMILEWPVKGKISKLEKKEQKK